ncbi:MAG: CvpA family protein [Clostridia bacterium]|nr:CvpA family protein [Clostridia bacterium]
MNIFVDIVLVLVMVLGLVIGYLRGFVKGMRRPVRFIGALVLAFVLCDVVSINILEPIIKAPLSSQIESAVLKSYNEADGYPTLVEYFASAAGVDLYSAESVHDAVLAVVSPLVHFVSVIISFILVYFIAKLLISLLLSLINGVFEHTVLSIPNRIIGAIFGAFIAFTAAWALVSVFDFAIHTSMLEGVSWTSSFNGGYIYNFFKEFTPIDLLLSF